jgi:hypothetical protein
LASKTFSGARAIFMINSVPVAFAGGVSGEEAINYEPVDVLTLLEVREFVPVAYTATLNAQVFRVVGSSLKQLGIMPREEDIITTGDLEAAVQDIVTRQTMALFQGVRCAGHSFDITARGIVQENVQFVCIRVLDEGDSAGLAG